MLEKVIGVERNLIICEFPRSSCSDAEFEKEIIVTQLVNKKLRRGYNWINKNTEIGKERNNVVKAFRLWQEGALNKDNNFLKTESEVAKFILLLREIDKD